MLPSPFSFHFLFQRNFQKKVHASVTFSEEERTEKAASSWRPSKNSNTMVSTRTRAAREEVVEAPSSEREERGEERGGEENVASTSRDENNPEREQAAASEPLAWKAKWEPSGCGLPGAWTGASAAREALEDVVRAKGEESARRRRAMKDHALLPEQEITPEVKRDFRLLRLRGVMDPKRFYKGVDETKIPKRFQWGTVIEGPTEFYSSRMSKKERKQNFTEEILGDTSVTAYRKRKFKELQAEAQKLASRQGKQAKKKPRRKTFNKKR